MPSYKYGARQFAIQGQFFPASTAATLNLGAYEYLPAAQANQIIDGAAETIKAATLIFATSVAQANSTAAGGSVVINALQVNSLASQVNSAQLYSQVAASQAALTPIDVTSKLNTWVLQPGDQIVLQAATSTVAIPAGFSACILSGTIDTVTSW